MPRPFLVFIRAGEGSLHRRLLAEDPGRNWDCCVSWYVTTPQPEQGAEYYSGGGFNKFDGFLEFWGQRPAGLEYRHLLLLDDDVYLRPGDVSRFFLLCERYQTYLAQPALHWFTNTTLNALVRNPACLLRRVNYVEVMAPCFSQAALAELIGTFGLTRSTWGTDLAWAGQINGRHPIYVVDAIGMDHTRAGDGRPGLFYRRLTAMGVDPYQELRAVQARYPALRSCRTQPGGHVYRAALPAALAPSVMWLIERAKFIVRLRKRALFRYRYWRASLVDALGRAR
jgi:hypothetical protein